MLEGKFRDVAYFTLAWRAFALLLIAAQPGPLLHGMPSLVRPAEAAQASAAPHASKAARILLVAALEAAE